LKQVYPGENYWLPWRKLLVTLAKTTRQHGRSYGLNL